MHSNTESIYLIDVLTNIIENNTKGLNNNNNSNLYSRYSGTKEK